MIAKDKKLAYDKLSKAEKIVQVASTLAIEEMYIGTDIIQNLLAVAKNEKTIDDCIRELDEIYGR
ncbi:MAG: hypothetical protein U0L56_11665 [Lachnospiraceae bacterium]|nr:hypothetical protein [Lachnospiraceae bacterium]